MIKCIWIRLCFDVINYSINLIMLLLDIHVITKINDQTKRNKLSFKLFLKQNWRFMKGYLYEVLEKKQLTSCSLFDTWCKRGTATINIKEFRFSKWNLMYLSLGTSVFYFKKTFLKQKLHTSISYVPIL